MNPRRLLLLTAGWLTLGASAPAFPPAPFHTYYGTVRDELGKPLDTTKKAVHIARQLRERKLQRALMQFFKPENWFLVHKTLLEAGRK